MQKFAGTIKSFVPNKGWGFIECEETFDIYGKDMFVMRTSLPNGTVERGDPVTFIVEQGKSGPEATNVQIRRQNSARGHAGASAGRGAVKMENGDGRYVGVVKSFNPAKGWGIIECEETFAHYGKDMFVLKSSLPNGHVEPGTNVSFVIIEGLKGPEAGEVQLVPQRRAFSREPQPSWATRPRPARPAFPRAPPQPAMWVPQPQLPAWGVPAFGGAQPSTNRVLQTHHAGEVKSFNAEKGWGFITATSHDFGKDVFVMRTALPPEGVSPGDKVQFKIKMGQKGYEADEVLVVPDVEELSGQIYEGSVKSYNATKGWGFIVSDAAQQMFGRDIFFHKRDLGEHTPTVGEHVEFSVTNNQQGHPQAVSLSFGGGYRPAKGGGKKRAKPY